MKGLFIFKVWKRQKWIELFKCLFDILMVRPRMIRRIDSNSYEVVEESHPPYSLRF